MAEESAIASPEPQEQAAQEFFNRNARAIQDLRRRSFHLQIQQQQDEQRRREREAEDVRLEAARLEREAIETAYWEDFHREYESERARHAAPPKHHDAETGRRLHLEHVAAQRAELAAEEDEPSAESLSDSDLCVRILALRAALARARGETL